MSERVILPTREELLAQEDEFLAEDGWMDVDISGNILDVTEAYFRPKYTLSYNGAPFAPLGGIHALTGQPGNGKTMTFTQLMVAVLKGAYGGLKYELSEELPEPRVLYIDTEMEKGNTQLVNLRVYSMMGWTYGVPHDEFKVLWLREEEKAEDRWRKTLKAIYELKPTVVFLDGLLDVIHDFNDNTECQEMIYKCMKAASHYQISMWCLVHENPGSTKMVGHLGSMLERKVTDAFGTRKKKEGDVVTFDIVQKKARGKDIEDMHFRVEDGPFGVPVQILPEAGPKSAGDEMPDTADASVCVELMTMDQLCEMQLLITTHDGLTTRDMREGVKQLYKVGATKADKILARGVEFGVIARGEDKRYYLPDKGVEQAEAPF